LYYPKNQLSDCSETSGGNQTCGLLYVKPSTQTVLYTYRYEILVCFFLFFLFYLSNNEKNL